MTAFDSPGYLHLDHAGNPQAGYVSTKHRLVYAGRALALVLGGRNFRRLRSSDEALLNLFQRFALGLG